MDEARIPPHIASVTRCTLPEPVRDRSQFVQYATCPVCWTEYILISNQGDYWMNRTRFEYEEAMRQAQHPDVLWHPQKQRPQIIKPREIGGQG